MKDILLAKTLILALLIPVFTISAEMSELPNAAAAEVKIDIETALKTKHYPGGQDEGLLEIQPTPPSPGIISLKDVQEEVLKEVLKEKEENQSSSIEGSVEQ